MPIVIKIKQNENVKKKNRNETAVSFARVDIAQAQLKTSTHAFVWLVTSSISTKARLGQMHYEPKQTTTIPNTLLLETLSKPNRPVIRQVLWSSCFKWIDLSKNTIQLKIISVITTRFLLSFLNLARDEWACHISKELLTVTNKTLNTNCKAGTFNPIFWYLSPEKEALRYKDDQN